MKTLKAILVPLTALFLHAESAFAYDCQQFANELFSYLAGSGTHTVVVEKGASTHRFENRLYSSYARAQKSVGPTSSTTFSIDVDTAFSDRDYFSGSRRDKERITFYRNGEIEIMLLSWGNTRLWLDNTRCYQEGLITGSIWAGNGKSSLTLSVVKK